MPYRIKYIVVAVFISVNITSYSQQILSEFDTLRVDNCVILNSVKFKKETLMLSPDGVATLDRLVRYLMDNTKTKIKVTVHTAELGSKSANFDLSLQRANNVANYLSKQGIKERRIKYYGYGQYLPLVSSKTPNSTVINSRIEISVYKKT